MNQQAPPSRESAALSAARRNSAPRIRVLIIEDSLTARTILAHIIGNDPRLEVVGAAATAEEGLRLLGRVCPDVISLDIRLPGMNGFEATRRIMADRPTPIVVVAASVESDDLHIALNALKAGALSVVEKPVGATHAAYEELAVRLCSQLATMSKVAVVGQRFHFRRQQVHRPASPIFAGRETSGMQRRIQFVGLVASTGGPRALHFILSRLPPDFPAPIAVVQHITASFHAGFVHWLDRGCPLPVQCAKPYQRPCPGHVYVAPPDRHLLVTESALRLSGYRPVSAERPSGTVLLNSLAETFGSGALGVLLTGMGDDGAEGLAHMHRAGGHTIAEDASTAAVYGMPAAAVKLGAVCESLPLPQIPERILMLSSQRQESR